MMVRQGWNTDFGKMKFDVGLDETDLARILSEAGIPPDAELTELEAFRLLLLETEYMSESVRAVRLQLPQAKSQADKSLASRDELLGKIAVRLDLQPDGND